MRAWASRAGDRADRGRPRRRLPDQRAVGVQYALGVRGRTRGVHHDRQVGGGDLGLDRGQHARAAHVAAAWSSKRVAQLRSGVAGEHDAAQVRRSRAWRAVRPAARTAAGSAASNRSATSMSSTLLGATSSPMSASRSTLAISAGVYIVLSGTASAPIRDTASHQMTQSTPLGKNSPTRVPLPTPCMEQPARDVRRTLLRLLVGEPLGRRDQVGVLAELACGAREECGNGGSGLDHPRIIDERCTNRRMGPSARLFFLRERYRPGQTQHLPAVLWSSVPP